MQAMQDLLVEHVALLDIDIIVGLDSKGFLLGPIVSLGLAKPFIPIRKKGKLPGKVFQQNYTLEYGEVFITVAFLYFIIDRNNTIYF
jgi:adenine phosphoribosyltransferase